MVVSILVRRLTALPLQLQGKRIELKLRDCMYRWRYSNSPLQIYIYKKANISNNGIRSFVCSFL